MAEHGSPGYARKWSSLRLLRNVPAKFGFLARVADPAVIRCFALEAQSDVDRTFRELFELQADEITPDQLAQVHLPPHRGPAAATAVPV